MDENERVSDSTEKYSGSRLPWSADDLRRALLRRASFTRAGRRRRRSGEGIVHAGVSRRAVRRLGLRAAAGLVRGGGPPTAGALVNRLMQGLYHDEQILAIEILDRLADVWPLWAVETTAALSRGLRHIWVADRLAQVQGRLISRDPTLLGRHVQWAVSQSPLRRRAAALALLPRRGPRGSRGVPAARAIPILRLLLQDPEPHPWVQEGVGRALVHYAERAPRTIARLLRGDYENLSPRHLARARSLLAGLSSAS